ncbi:MAG: hypothetical protein M1598_06640 [Actinobacteria bacterium]|nr:hypothetical protein [Actinomycetota bacterium]
MHSIMQRAYDEYRGLLNPASSDHSETVALNGGTLQRYVAQESGWFTERDNYSVGRFFPD